MSPAAATAPNANASGQQQAQVPSIPFLAGSWEYTEPMTTLAVTPGTSQQDFVYSITPGGYLRGVSLQVTSTGGVIGSGVLAADAPWSVIAQLSLESIDGTPLLYPMGGYSAWLVSKYCRPWDGDPASDPAFSNSVNPSFNLRFFIESRVTIGVLPNTDARAQYRLRISIAPSTALFSTAPTTLPTLSVQINLETYAQPPMADYADNPIVQMPDGLCLQRFVSHETFVLSSSITIKSNRVGNLIRNEILVFRTSAGARIDLTADPIRWRLDNTQLLNEYRAHRRYDNNREFQFGEYTQGAATATPTGVYVYPRFHNPGDMQGMYWLPSTEASFLAWELQGTPASGSLEIITEDFAPAMDGVPAYLQGI